MPAGVSGNACSSWLAPVSLAQWSRSGDCDRGAGWGDSRKDSSFVMWKPMGEADAYGGLVGLEAAMIGELVLVGVLVVIDCEVFFIPYYCTASRVERDALNLTANLIQI